MVRDGNLGDAPQASFWRRFIRPIILKPQLQVASILLLAATGFYLLKSQRSESDVFREMKQPPAPAPMQSQPGKPVEAHDKVAQEPRSAPKEMQNPLSEGVNKLRMEESKPSESGFAPPPPPAQTPKAEIAKQERDMEPSKPSALPAPAPSLLAGAAVGGGTPATAEATAPTARQTKKGLKGADGPARVNRADEMAKEKSYESSGQLMDQADRKDKNDSATWIIRMEIPDPRSAKALIERELAKIGATLISQRESGTPHVVRARLDSRRLPELLSRLARIGKVLEQPDFTSEKPSQIIISIHW